MDSARRQFKSFVMRRHLGRRLAAYLDADGDVEGGTRSGEEIRVPLDGLGNPAAPEKLKHHADIG